MKQSVFVITHMDCPTEEALIRVSGSLCGHYRVFNGVKERDHEQSD